MNSYQNNTKKLEVKNLIKSFGETKILEGINIDLNQKEFVSLLGLSGSGKSTIFNIIAGLLKPDHGNIYLEGQDVTGLTGKVSYMYQKDLLLPWKKIIDNVCLPLVIKGENKKNAREAVKDYFKVFGLDGYEDSYPFQLSGGMRQRAALLRTYMFSKDIMLLDEPFGGLDAITKSRMHHWLLEVLDNLNTSVLFITHDIEEAILLSDRIYILSDKPAGIKDEITVDLRKPRDVTSDEFSLLKKRIINLL